MNRLILGCSHKMYFSFEQSREWCQQVNTILRHPHYQTLQADLTLFTFPAMPAISMALEVFTESPMGVGAQNIGAEPRGAWTGETSAEMIREMGGRFAEIGHAERRNHFHETPAMIAQKIEMALRSGLTPVVCIGEQQPLSSEKAAEEAIHEVQALLQRVSLATRCEAEIIFAWEPQWAIGAQVAADEGYIRVVCRHLREYLHVHCPIPARVIYGGSAGPGLLKRLWPDVDGLFLGRFAHDPQEFKAVLDEALEMLSFSGAEVGC